MKYVLRRRTLDLVLEIKERSIYLAINIIRRINVKYSEHFNKAVAPIDNDKLTSPFHYNG